MSLARVVSAAVAVHRELGPGMSRSHYVESLAHELARNGVRFARDVPVPITFHGLELEPVRIDFLVEGDVLVDVKAVESIRPSHAAQLTALMRQAGKCVGVLINFHAPILKLGLRKRTLRPEAVM
jgi:GxxExxY protein